MNNNNCFQTHKSLLKKYFCSILSFCFCASLYVIFPVDVNSNTNSEKFPIKFQKITKKQSHYNSPENTFSARISALLSQDLGWLYNTLTKESAERNRKAFADAKMDPSLMFQMMSHEDQIFILDKFPYKEGIALIVQKVRVDGGILTGPVIFVKEEGLWKQTSAFNNDEELSDFRKVVLPSSIITADIKMFPSHWNIKRIFLENDEPRSEKKSQFNGNTVLCIIKSIRDNKGNIYPITEVDPTKLKLNYQLSPLSVRRGKHVLGHKDENWFFPEEYALLEEWDAVNKNKSILQKQYLAVRFDLKNALETLGELQDGMKYQVNITGVLGVGINFRGESTITIAPEQRR